MIDELVKASVPMMHKPVATAYPSLIPSQFFLNGSKILLTNITNITFLFTAKKAIYIAYQYHHIKEAFG